MALHKDIVAADQHICHAFSYLGKGARQSATGLVAGDVGKIAHQTDDNTYWMLTSVSPVNWVEITTAGLTSDTSGMAQDLVELQQRLDEHIADDTDPHGIAPSYSRGLLLGTDANGIQVDGPGGTVTPTGTASPLTIEDLVLPQLGILPGTGNYTCGQEVGPYNGSFSATLDTLYCVPFIIGRQITIDALAISVIVQAGQKVRLGVYDSITATGLPGTLLAEATELTTSTNNTLETQTVSPDLVLNPGLYYMAMLVDAASLSVGASYAFGHTMMMAFPLSSFNVGWSMYGNRSYTYAALPSSWGTPGAYVANGIYSPRIAMREA